MLAILSLARNGDNIVVSPKVSRLSIGSLRAAASPTRPKPENPSLFISALWWDVPAIQQLFPTDGHHGQVDDGLYGRRLCGAN